jgi:hypothetical protein
LTGKEAESFCKDDMIRNCSDIKVIRQNGFIKKLILPGRIEYIVEKE